MITTFHLPNLQKREQDLQDAAADLDVSEAGNVAFNPREISQQRGAVQPAPPRPVHLPPI